MTRDARFPLGERPLPLKDTNSQGAFIVDSSEGKLPRDYRIFLIVSVHRCNVIFLSRRVLHNSVFVINTIHIPDRLCLSRMEFGVLRQQRHY